MKHEWTEVAYPLRDIDGENHQELRLDLTDVEFISIDLVIRNFTGMLHLRASSTTYRPLIDIHTSPLQLLVAKNIVLGLHHASRVILKNAVIFSGPIFRTIHAGYFDHRECHEVISVGDSMKSIFLCSIKESLLNITETLDELETALCCGGIEGSITAEDSCILITNEYICRTVISLGCIFYVVRAPALICCATDNVFIRFLSPTTTGISSVLGNTNNLWLESVGCDRIKLIINGELDALWPFGPAQFIISGLGGILHLCIYDQRKPFIMDLIRARQYCHFESITWNGHVVIE